MKTVYTAIIGSYDDLKEPTVISEGWRYICFTDQLLTSNVWEIRQIAPGIDPRRTARGIKINFHKYISDELSLWLDASFQINCDLNIVWQRCFKAPFSAPAHPVRSCVYQEVRSCLVNNRGESDLVIKQGDQYESEGVPAFNGIITSGVLLRQRCEATIDLCELWWQELCKHSSRDQIAFAKVSIGHKFNTFNWDYSQSKEIKYIRHIHLRN